jgi:myo-inositol-1(or 4)-monophosphatase
MGASRPSASTLRALLSTARSAVRMAGTRVRRAGLRPPELRRKGPGDFVTDLDLRVEDDLRRWLTAAHPGHGFLGEESGPSATEKDLVWVVDPIDGTSNFGRGLPCHAVAVACLFRGRPVAAAMSCQPEDRIYSAAAGLGAFRGRRRIRMQPRRLDDRAIIGCQWHRSSTSLGFVEDLVATGARLRNLGSTVVQLCDLVMGRLDANVQEQGRIWDIAAPGLLVMEAGGRFTSWDGRPVFPADLDGSVHHPTLAAAPALHRRLTNVLPRSVSPP